MSDDGSAPRSQYPCPTCGFLVFDEPSGSFNICPICGWEDDDVQLQHPSLAIGANRHSLWQEQELILQRYPTTVREAKGYERDPKWRPLKPEELVTAGVPQTGREYFDAMGDDPPAYYWLKEKEER